VPSMFFYLLDLKGCAYFKVHLLSSYLVSVIVTGQFSLAFTFLVHYFNPYPANVENKVNS